MCVEIKNNLAMPSYIQRRRRRWYALLNVPKDVRHAIGKPRYVKSLETESENAALLRAAPLIARWKAEIASARGRGTTTTDPLAADIDFWRRALAEPMDEDTRDGVTGLLLDRAERLERKAEGAGVEFYKIATGQLVAMADYVEEWLATTLDTGKVKDRKRADVRRFAATFATVQDVRRSDVRRWVTKLMNGDGLAPGTVQRILSALRGYWRYLQSIEVAGEEHEPFDRLDVARQNKRTARFYREIKRVMTIQSKWYGKIASYTYLTLSIPINHRHNVSYFLSIPRHNILG